MNEHKESNEVNVREMNVYERIHYAGTLIQGRVPKDGVNTFDKYNFSSHDGVVAFVRSMLQKARIILCIEPGQFQTEIVESEKGKRQVMVQGNMTASIVNIDKPDDRHVQVIPVMALDRSDKAHGKAISYGKKYCITACMGLLLATGEDSDNDSPYIEDAKPRTLDQAAEKIDPEKKQEAIRTEAKKSLWATAQKHGLQDVAELEVYANAQGINKPLGEMTPKEMNTLEGKIIIARTGAPNNE